MLASPMWTAVAQLEAASTDSRHHRLPI